MLRWWLEVLTNVAMKERKKILRRGGEGEASGGVAGERKKSIS